MDFPWATFGARSFLALTLGATTGRLIADLVSRRAPAQDLTPFSANRFAFIGGHA